MTRDHLTLAGSSLLLALLLLVVGGLLALVGSTVLLPQGQVTLVVAGAALAFLAIQLVVFRLLRLRSRADEHGRTRDEPPPAAAEDRDWRAWRG